MTDIYNPKILGAILNVIPDILLIINSRREVVYANRRLFDILGVADFGEHTGKTPGDIFHCANACKEPGGCGFSEFCKVCGMSNAMKDCPEDSVPRVSECRMTKAGSGEPLDLRIWVSKVNDCGQLLTVVSVADICDEKRRHMLERIFFHDIMNMAGGIQSALNLLRNSPGKDIADSLLDALEKTSNALVDEINAQKQFLSAEKGDLELNLSACNSLDELKYAVEIYRSHEAGIGRKIIIEPASEAAELITDKTILRRVLGNLLKNALEASRLGGEVRAACKYLAETGETEFRVKNEGVIPYLAKLQIFQRSFSTKGADRGLGTYSIKLLTEKYLKGSAGFESSEEKGTEFFIRLKNSL